MPVPSPHAKDPALLAIGAAIRSLRQARGISQEELAHRCGIERSYMSSIERGLQNSSVIALMRIVRAIGVSLEELIREARI